MKKRSSAEIRQLFLDYFLSKKHMVEPSANLIPIDDPTLLWINAGVAALKKYFDGRETPRSRRITNAQKCIRTNDIESVGKTGRHHTFFEMLGNFSIGDYFKEDAIKFAWEFLTSEDYIGFEKDRLYISVYPQDTEAYRIWTEVIGVDPHHILKSDDNFWEIGEGPSGPDTEIYYDRGEAYDPEGSGEKLFFEELENERYIEVWNVVFSQYDAKPELDRNEYQELPQKNIDTGMGLERLVCLVQDGETNYDTDLFLPLIHEVEKIARYPYEGEYKMAYRVIADHIRTITFALADGASFSNEGRGYVVRRVLRRAMRYARKLEIKKPFLYTLVPTVCEIMKEFYPYLADRSDFSMRLIEREELSFLETLSQGEKLLNEELDKAKDSGTLSGEVIFKLYDTYGFPAEMTIESALDSGLKCDEEGFKKAMQQQVERARNSRHDAQSMHNQSEDLLNLDVAYEFTGYFDYECDSKVVAMFVDGKQVEEAEAECDIVFDKSCFYAESGGQVADKGSFINESGLVLEVLDVQKAPNGQALHHVSFMGKVKVGDSFKGKIVIEKRQRTMANHSSLHLLQSALKLVLGDHIAQAGSYVCADYGRFDFTHYQKPSELELDRIEKYVNQWINEAYEVTTEVLAIEEAKKTGATALFNEKYGDFVRVVSMGEVSKEFCGGTHVNNISKLSSFKILSEESIGSGIRRISCCTKMASYQNAKDQDKYLRQLRDNLGLKNANDIKDRVRGLMDENSELKQRLKQYQERLNTLEADSLSSKAKEVRGLKYLVMEVEESYFSKDYANLLRQKLNDGFVFIVKKNEDKLAYIASVSKAWNDVGIKAGALVKEVATKFNGKGGGRDDVAQGGCCGQINEILNYVSGLLLDSE